MAVDVVTFGCRLNIVESDVIRREAERAGLQDTIVVNTCAVTNEAVAQARQTIRKLRRDRPDARIVVTGCAAQTQAQMFAQMGEVDRVLGNGDKVRFEAWRDTRTVFDGGGEKVAVSDIMAVREMAPHLASGFRAGCRARSCRCRMAAITVVPSASFPMAAAIHARWRWARWSIRCVC
jgi:threonylcarbamoyladenosine tRNA methylthiotransferase MtaB